jgi:hypothetical protein
MKTTMLKSLAIIAFFIVLGMNAMAQSSNANLSASATILDEITVEQEQDLTFGQVQVGSNKTIDLDGNVTSSSNGISTVGTGVGRFMLAAGAGSNVKLSFTLPAALDGPNSATLPMSFTEDPTGTALDLVGYGNSDDANGATRFSAVNGVDIAGFPTNSINNKNGIYVFVGGTVKAAADQAIGQYTGTVTLTAEYN